VEGRKREKEEGREGVREVFFDIYLSSYNNLTISWGKEGGIGGGKRGERIIDQPRIKLSSESSDFVLQYGGKKKGRKKEKKPRAGSVSSRLWEGSGARGGEKEGGGGAPSARRQAKTFLVHCGNNRKKPNLDRCREEETQGKARLTLGPQRGEKRKIYRKGRKGGEEGGGKMFLVENGAPLSILSQPYTAKLNTSRGGRGKRGLRGRGRGEREEGGYVGASSTSTFTAH